MTFKKRFELTKRAYKSIEKITPGFLLATVISSAFSSLSPFVGILMSSILINAIASGESLSRLLLLGGITVGSNLLIFVLSEVFQKKLDCFQTRFWMNQDAEMRETILTTDYENMENSKIHGLKSQIDIARMTNGYGLPSLLWITPMLVTGVLTVIFSVSLVVSAFTAVPASNPDGFLGFITSPFAIAVFVILFVLNNYVIFWGTKVTSKNNQEISKTFQNSNRIGMYIYENVLVDYKAGKDIKLYDLTGFLGKYSWDNMNEILKVFKKYWYKKSACSCLTSLSSTLLIAAAYGYVIVKAMLHCFGAGDIVRYVGAITQLNTGLSTLMRAVSQIIANADYLESYYEFVDMESAKQKGSLPVEKRAFCDIHDNDYSIEFRNVSFKYPGSNDYVLKSLSFSLKIGGKLAVVGMNGSGKTTMIKLLCRLYDPTEGEITLNGIDIKKYDYNEYLSIFSVVFQDFKLFATSLGENVAASLEVDRQKAVKALELSGFGERYSKMEKGLDTNLYKDFDEEGVEISGGEAQKIALARAMYKNAPFIILDEPTAALDPISEYEIYSKFNGIVGERTAVYISHRLSSCRFCSDIAVFHEGQLIQRGSHEELLKNSGGKYHELWHSQAAHYNKSAKV